MCGICGVKNVPLGALDHVRTAMLDSLAHRGPDARGEYCDDNAQLFLGATRLSIVDLTSAGSQPIFNEDRSLVLVCNGEIYNAPALRAELLQHSHRFQSATDVEVILHLYEEMGVECLGRLKGMFAFALWDSRKNLLWVARDRLGIKPLYYYCASGVFAFASELKTLMKLPLIRRDLDVAALDLYFLLEYVPSPFSIYQGVSKLKPGSFLIYDAHGVKEFSYWNLNERKGGESRLSFSEAQDRLEFLLQKSVREHLMADVPVGVLLSGGLDSSALAVLASRYSSGKCSTFSIGFNEKSFDETEDARRTAHFLGTEHHHCYFTMDRFHEIFPDVARLIDEPFGDLSVFPTHFLSRFARQHVKTALSGEGGDELFMGYPTYKAHGLMEGLKYVPSSVIKSVPQLMSAFLPVSAEYFSLGFKVRQFLRAEHVWRDPALRHLCWMGSFLPAEKDCLYSQGLKSRLLASGLNSHLESLMGRSGFDRPLKKVQYLDIYGYLADDLLVKGDRASMAASLELRVPLLDHELMAFAWSLPERYIFQKRIFRSVVQSYLPALTLRRKKKGFAIPFSQWLQDGRFGALIGDFFSESYLKRQGLFDPQYVNQMLREQRSLKRDHRKKLGTYIMFQVWYQREFLNC